MPLVSVVIPTHNRPQMLAEALASVRAQTFTDYEIIVVSNGEGDEMRHASKTVALAEKAYYFVLPAGNVSAARNFGVEQAVGEWIALLDDDDLWLPAKLERQVAEAQKTSADMVAHDYVEFYQDGKEITYRPRVLNEWPYVKSISHGHWWASVGSTLIRKHVFDATGGFDSNQRFAEDNDFWRRISWRHTIHQMDGVLMRYRRGHAQVTQDKRAAYRYDLRHFGKMRRDTPEDLQWAVPSFAAYAWPRLMVLYMPDWTLAVLTRLRPRYRWIRFRQWLRPRTRLRRLRCRLGGFPYTDDGWSIG